MKRLKIPIYAKNAARKGLFLRSKLSKSKKFGLSPEMARMQGINSGVSRAKQLIRQDSLSLKDARSVANFYNRFKGCKTRKCEGALLLWGGRRFGRKANAFLK